MTDSVKFVDQRLTCGDCGESFVWSAADQAFFAQNGWPPPIRCFPCRQAIRFVLHGKTPGASPNLRRVCSDCSSPFELSKTETDWFYARGLAIPRRCARCRRMRREQRRTLAAD